MTPDAGRTDTQLPHTVTTPRPPAAPPAPPFGDHFDEVVEVGEGGMGRVYRATDRKLGRTVAIKLLRSTDPFECGRFRGEAELIALLDHPNIVKIY
ncbi:MAG: hypothetical protein K2V38_13190, partial [Gemmataceae bacterium]|nr:hypothetical protein [Gemmataceae bacterium]